MDTENSPIYLRKMASPEVRAFAKESPIAILPVGSIEQHGSHLPIDTDLSTIEYLAEGALKKARNITGLPMGIIAPSIPYGGPGIGMTEWPGTICLKPSTLIDLVFDIGSGLAASGFLYIVVMNGCYGNIASLTLAVQKLKVNRPDADFILVEGDWEIPDLISKIRSSGPGGMGHACELETSTALVIDPEHVHMDKAKAGHLHHPSDQVSFDFDQKVPFYWPYPFGKLVENGVIGNPEEGTAEKGKIILDANTDRVADILCHIYQIFRNRADFLTR